MELLDFGEDGLFPKGFVELEFERVLNGFVPVDRSEKGFVGGESRGDFVWLSPELNGFVELWLLANGFVDFVLGMDFAVELLAVELGTCLLSARGFENGVLGTYLTCEPWKLLDDGALTSVGDEAVSPE